MSGSISALQPDLQPWAQELVNASAAAGLNPRITSTYRSHAQQKALYDRYLRGQQSFPVARPGTSAHEFGWAFDMVTTPFDALADVGYTWNNGAESGAATPHGVDPGMILCILSGPGGDS